MSEVKDLTRWNRAGLNRFIYLNGNAVEYLEILRQRLVKNFPESTGHGKWLNPAEQVPANEEKAEGETLIQRQERLSNREERIVEMYHQDRRDWAWEITRTFARSCHILTGYADAYANEGYLGTATQWNHVRRLVEMLGYYPAPPASASTKLVLEAKQSKSGLVKKGWQVKYKPPDGGDKIIFETLSDIVVDPALNGLRPNGWNQSDEPVLSAEHDETAYGGRQFSELANGPAIDILGVEGDSVTKLNELSVEADGIFKIKDFPDLDPDTVGPVIGIGQGSLWEWKAKADIVVNFAPEGDWSALADSAESSLFQIAEKSAQYLADDSGNSWEMAESLKEEIEKVEMSLDPDVYLATSLRDLFVSEVIAPGVVVTSWHTKPGSSVSPGQVAMIFSESRDQRDDEGVVAAEAATVAGIEKQSKAIHLLPSSIPYEWSTWSKGEARLMVSPHWKRKCWLNGKDVIRTVEPHGFSADSFVGWVIEYDLSLVDVLLDEGTSVVNIADVGGLLHIRIFDEEGTMAVDKWEDAYGARDMLFSGDALIFLKDLGPLSALPVVSEEEKRIIIEYAFLCAGYSKWRHAKVIEVDKRSLRLKVKGLVPQEKGVKIYELRPIEGSVIPANHDAVVLVEDEGEGISLEDVAPDIKIDDSGSIFSINKVLTGDMTDSDGGGGGLLPPASLPEIGSFLFPSPMLPMDLVKAAVDLMLSIGVMAIPSTEEIVIKGMPFGGLLEQAASLDDAADSLYEMLNELEGIVHKHSPTGEPYWKNIDDTIEDSVYDGNPEDYYLDTDPAKPNLLLDEDHMPIPQPTSIEVQLVVWNDDFAGDVGSIKSALKEMLGKPEGKESAKLFQKLTEDIVDKGPLLAVPREPIVKAVSELKDPLYIFNGNSKIGVGDWVVCEFSSDVRRALKVKTVDWSADIDETETFSLTFEALPDEKELRKVYTDFRSELIAKEATLNITQVEDEIELEKVPESLKVGHEILLTAEGKDPVEAKVESIDGKKIKLNVSPIDFKKGELIIRGNIVDAGHGELKPAKILGSGNAVKSNQEFTLKVEAVSFIADPTKGSGVAAAIDVEVAGQRWKQVSTLKDSAPDDKHYVVRMTEDGYVKIIFGDGQFGRRLPTDRNNVRVRCREGSGLPGNVPSGSLEKPVNPHRLIDKVLQPQLAAGGGDMEDLNSLRENAPPTLLTLERAVSLLDFSHLASAQSSVWQAMAYNDVMHEGRMERVTVVIVPAGGAISDGIKKDVRSFLQKHALREFMSMS